MSEPVLHMPEGHLSKRRARQVVLVIIIRFTCSVPINGVSVLESELVGPKREN